MSFNINNFDYYDENYTEHHTEMDVAQLITSQNDQDDDFLYEAELAPCNDTHYCVTIVPNSGVSATFDYHAVLQGYIYYIDNVIMVGLNIYTTLKLYDYDPIVALHQSHSKSIDQMTNEQMVEKIKERLPLSKNELKVRYANYLYYYYYYYYLIL